MTPNQAPASGSEFMSSIVGGKRLWGACQAHTHRNPLVLIMKSCSHMQVVYRLYSQKPATAQRTALPLAGWAHTHARTRAHTRAHTLAHTLAHTHASLHMQTRAYTHTNVCTHTHAHTHTHTHMHIDMHTHTHTHRLWLSTERTAGLLR